MWEFRKTTGSADGYVGPPTFYAVNRGEKLMFQWEDGCWVEHAFYPGINDDLWEGCLSGMLGATESVTPLNVVIVTGTEGPTVPQPPSNTDQ